MPVITPTPSTLENRHNAVGAWFLGPRAENFTYLKNIFEIILKEQEKARKAYYPDDTNFISKDMQASDEFKTEMDDLNRVIGTLSEGLAKHSVPFWSPRYNGHMCMDTTIPGIAGYLAGMLFNSNNVAVEASPLTTVIEREVGLELSEMVGFNIDPTVKPTAWGHIACGGSIANLEAVWASRNLKFYPLSLRLAMKPGRALEFIADSFEVKTCTGKTKLLSEFTTWELLNIIPDEVLNIPDRLYAEYQITTQYLSKSLSEFLIQNISKDADIFDEFDKEVDIGGMALMTSATKHYSWPKAAAITGIGCNNLLGIKVDDDARMDMDDLRRHLDQCLEAKRAVYIVVSILGSTEHGACDPLDKMVKLRTEYRKKGLSFVLHADGAWGTYFASILPRGARGEDDTVPSLALKPTTASALKAMRYCESVTVDPHKSGFIQYPAGGLLYRDGRMRYQVSWTSPIVFRDDLESMGVYGIEGSKPGAAPVAAWVSHQVIGLNEEGYGEILGEALFSCVKLYAHLATMSTENSDFILTPLNKLPAEFAGTGVEEQKEFIRTHILNKPNAEIVKDDKAMQLIRDMGSDLAINAFAVNFKIDGKVNEDVMEANNLNKRIFERLSINDDKKEVGTVPLVLTSTELAQKEYASCLTNFKSRLGLVGDQDLYTLVNVVVSPFPTAHNFTAYIASELQKVIKEEVATSQLSNTITPDLHGFIMQGTDKVYLIHLPMFFVANHRVQLVITGDLPADIMAKYVEARRKDPSQMFTLGNAKRDTLEAIVKQGWMDAYMNPGPPPETGDHWVTGFKMKNIKVVLKRPLETKEQLAAYPRSSMPFYIYGTNKQVHIDHALLLAPNIQLNSDQVRLDGPDSLPPLDNPLYVHLQNKPEAAMQPFLGNDVLHKSKDFFFQPGSEFPVTISDDLDGKHVLWEGTLTLGDVAFSDVDDLNSEPQPKAYTSPDSAHSPSGTEPPAKSSPGQASGNPLGDLISAPIKIGTTLATAPLEIGADALDSFATAMSGHKRDRTPQRQGYVDLIDKISLRDNGGTKKTSK